MRNQQHAQRSAADCQSSQRQGISSTRQQTDIERSTAEAVRQSGVASVGYGQQLAQNTPTWKLEVTASNTESGKRTVQSNGRPTHTMDVQAPLQLESVEEF